MEIKLKKEIKLRKHYSTPEVAELLNVSTQCIYMAAKRELLESIKKIDKQSKFKEPKRYFTGKALLTYLKYHSHKAMRNKLKDYNFS